MVCPNECHVLAMLGNRYPECAGSMLHTAAHLRPSGRPCAARTVVRGRTNGKRSTVRPTVTVLIHTFVVLPLTVVNSAGMGGVLYGA